jgi:hypothetical protein
MVAVAGLFSGFRYLFGKGPAFYEQNLTAKASEFLDVLAALYFFEGYVDHLLL